MAEADYWFSLLAKSGFLHPAVNIDIPNCGKLADPGLAFITPISDSQLGHDIGTVFGSVFWCQRESRCERLIYAKHDREPKHLNCHRMPCESWGKPETARGSISIEESLL